MPDAQSASTRFALSLRIVYNHQGMPFNRPLPKSSKPQNTRSAGIKSLVEAEKLIQIAVLLPVSALVGWMAGAWLGKKLGLSWLPLAGILVGGVLGLIYVVRLGMMNTASRNSGPGDGGKQ